MEPREHPPWSPQLLDALTRWGTDETGHSGRALLDHLVGTADRLRAWGNPLPICHAGLFHSVYGTQSFLIQSVPFERRGEVAALIGEPAERLAYLFCVCQRREFASGAPGLPVEVREHASGAVHTVPAHEIDQLLEIEVANLLDQLSPHGTRPDLDARMGAFAEGVRGRVSSGASAAFDAWTQGA